ncbi:MAG: OmpA family protein [Bacteroidota bacterium]
MIKRVLFFTLLITSVLGFAQKQDYSRLTSKSKKAKQYYISADKFFNYDQADNAVLELKKAIEEDSMFVEAHMLLGDVLFYAKKYKESVEEYKKTVIINPNFSIDNYYYLGRALYMIEDYASGVGCFREFLKLSNGADNALTRESKMHVTVGDFRAEMMKHPVPFNPINMGPNINSPYHEYLPSLTADENVILITRRDIREPDLPYSASNSQEDFFEARKVKGEWQKAFNIGAPINTPGNEGAECISADGRTVFFTINERPGGYGSCDIYMSKRTPMGWSDPENLGSVVNSEAWDTQPSFSSDGKTLYFVSTRPGGLGGSDIWKTVMKEDGSWTTPINLGPEINTKANENSPFIHPDDQTLYYATAGRMGMGGTDIFYSRKDAKGNFGTSINIGYPINSSENDDCLVIAPSGELAYFASKRDGGYGMMDLYYFELYKEARPSPVTYFKGKVYDVNTKEPLEAQFELIDLKTQELKIKSNSEAKTGEFFVPLATNSNYALNVSKKGYLFYSQNFSLMDRTEKTPYIMDVPLQPIGDNQIVVLNNIFFDTDKFDLKSESVAELEKLFGFLKNNPTLKIEVRGHTDNVGNDALNLTLSNNRAKSVYDYLITKGIAKERLQYKGYGETTPIATNDTEAGRQLNRRTEFKIIGK